MKPNRPVPLDGMVWHSSWTHNHFLKMTKLLVVGEWHLSNCRWYNPDFIPDFNFFKEFELYGGDEIRHTMEVIRNLITPQWKK